MFSHIFLTSFVYIISIILAGLRPWYNWDFCKRNDLEVSLGAINIVNRLLAIVLGTELNLDSLAAVIIQYLKLCSTVQSPANFSFIYSKDTSGSVPYLKSKIVYIAVNEIFWVSMR